MTIQRRGANAPPRRPMAGDARRPVSRPRICQTMKRFVVFLTFAFVFAVLVGCEKSGPKTEGDGKVDKNNKGAAPPPPPPPPLPGK